MKLSFECTLDPRSMPTVKGKKFCASCQKNVVDLRRKSDQKIASFFEANVTPCVIIYQDQLDRMPKRPLKKQQDDFRYLPYAAGVIAVSLLPAMSLAQTEIRANAQTIGIKPVTLPALDDQAIATAQKTGSKVIASEKYYVRGRVNIRDQKAKIKAGKEIVIYYYNQDTHERDTLATGKLGVNGKFKISLTKEQFDNLSESKENIRIDTEVFRRERIKEITFTENSVNILISVSAKQQRALMGRIAF
jgi:hypothetical protein